MGRAPLAERQSLNVATGALANKTERMISALLAHDRAYMVVFVRQPAQSRLTNCNELTKEAAAERLRK